MFKASLVSAKDHVRAVVCVPSISPKRASAWFHRQDGVRSCSAGSSPQAIRKVEALRHVRGLHLLPLRPWLAGTVSRLHSSDAEVGSARPLASGVPCSLRLTEYTRFKEEVYRAALSA